MAKHPLTDLICWLLAAAMLALTVGFMNGEALGIQASDGAWDAAYADLFDDSVVHTVDIVAEESDWAELLENAQAEEYIPCNVVIDGTAVKNVAVRAKGNTSLTQVTNGRYSLKIEFDHYETGKSYLGLDKLVLNNIIQDDTYLKDWLCYALFRQMDVPAPLASFAVVTVNGAYYGLCLAVEAVEESFLQRNFGAGYGDLYKPDSAEGGSDGSASLAYTTDAPGDYGDILDTAKTDVTEEEAAELIAALKALSEGDAASALDTEEVLRYFVVHNFVVNGDSYTGSMLHNYYLYQEDGKLAMLPWDYNLAFGSFSMGGERGGQMGGSASSAVNWPLDDPLLSGSLEDRPMLAWIFADETYTERYHQLMGELLTTCFDSGWFSEKFDQMVALLSPYVEADTTSFTDYETFLSASEELKTFCTLRAESLQGQLDGTIPSTSAGQAADSSSLIDTGDLSLSAMGGFGGGMSVQRQSRTWESGQPGQMEEGQSGMPEPPEGAGDFPGGTPPDMAAAEGAASGATPGEAASAEGEEAGGEKDAALPSQEGSADSRREDFTPPEGFSGRDGQNVNGGFGGPGETPGGQGEQTAAGGLPALLLTGAAVLVLLAGLLFAWKYRRR